MSEPFGETFKDCPHCAELVQVDAIICRFCDRGISSDSFKNCPRCTEMIWTGATYCRYCMSNLATAGDWNLMLKPDRKGVFEQIKAGTGIYLDDDAIDKIFQRMSRRAE